MIPEYGDFSQSSMLCDYDISNNPIYVGYPDPVLGGISDVNRTIWAIKRITYDGDNNPVSVGWTRTEQGAIGFNSTWSGRASETYT